jgi:glycosyltransferase involved in cell wall biosynthesis
MRDRNVPTAARPPRSARRVCLVTTLQPSANPRVVKEADALAEAGYEVRVVAAHWAEWASEFDRELLSSRSWTCETIDWRSSVNPALFWKSRIRHYAARKIGASSLLEPMVEQAALSRIGPELLPPATREPADLFIAHNLGALPVALAAGRVCGSPVGFDAEDFHSGQLSRPADRAQMKIVRQAERRLLPRCAYVTAASPAIADAYRDLCNIQPPVCVLNVFPLADRPQHYRLREPGAPVKLYWFSQTIGPDRGLEDAVRALGLLRDRRTEIHLRGRWAAGYEERLRAVASASGVEQWRLISHDPARPVDMVREAAAHDIGLALEPPVSVNSDLLISNKIFTYLLAGNAVLTTRTKGQSLLAPRLGEAAVYCDPGRPDSLAAALQPWLDHPERLESARSTAWLAGETRFNWDIEKAGFLAVVEAVFGARPEDMSSRFRQEALASA